MKKIRNVKQLSQFILVAILFAFTLVSCKKDDAGNSSDSASTTIKITDAPIDDISVTGAFVTITDIKVDGQSIQGFNKTTIDLMAYQNGTTKTIGTFNLAGKTYSNVTFVLDFDKDAAGNAPGCYVLRTGNIKHQLQSNSNIITISKSFSLVAAASNTIVADFDLRKMIKYQPGVPTDRYDFVTVAEMQNDIRIVVENKTGTVSGTLTDNISASGKVVAYVYQKGTFNRAIEMSGQGTSNVQFSNAVNSSSVAANGFYQLHFLESGLYEVHFASYKDTNADGEYELMGTLIVTGAGGLDLLNLNVAANVNLTVNASVTAVLP